jgi:hypothetical protein
MKFGDAGAHPVANRTTVNTQRLAMLNNDGAANNWLSFMALLQSAQRKGSTPQ